MEVRTYILNDGRAIRVGLEDGQWSAWLVEDLESLVVGFPLEGVLMEVVGLNPAHDEVPGSIASLADRVRAGLTS